MSWHSNVQDWRKYLYRRVLVISRLNSFLKLDRYPIEAEVLEVSPSGKYVKLKFGSAAKWVAADEYVVVEVLN